MLLPGDLYTDYFYENNSSMASVIECEGSFNSPVAYADGTEENFEIIKFATHKIESGFNTSMGIMKETFAIDDTGYWTIDNFSALFGLTTYKNIFVNRVRKMMS